MIRFPVRVRNSVLNKFYIKLIEVGSLVLGVSYTQSG